MSTRTYIAGLLTLALSACAWMPWHHRGATPSEPPEDTGAPSVPAVPAPVVRAPAMTKPPTVAAVPRSNMPPARPRPPGRAPIGPAPVPTAPVAPPPPPSAAPAWATPEKAPAALTRAAAAPAAPAAGALDLRGRVQLQAGRGQQLHPGEAVDTVVYFVPAAGAPAPATRRADVVTAHRDFRPSAIALPLGSTLRYVNRDTVRHNVFSVTPGAAFNLGYQAAGRSAEHVFAKPGLVLVSCNVHHSMEMDVFVVPSPYASRVGADGSFTVHGLPPGPGELVAWNPRARLVRQAVTLPAATPVTLSLLAERPRVVTRIGIGERP